MIAPGRQSASETGLKIDNRYEVLAELGRGGMGIVYKAKDLKMDRVVAIKLMALPPTERETYLQRFLLEAKSVAKMQHANIVVVYDYGYHGRDPYIAMEYVEGVALNELIASRAHLSLLVRVNYVIQVCNALHYAHQFGIVHRDVKPANIMVLEGGQKVKLLDFGIARAGGPSDLSRTGLAMGTTCYMSPEQTRGQKDLDFRSDIFSAGVVLYELMAGRAPWRGNSDYEIMDKIVREPFPPLSTALRSYPEGMDRVLESSLAKDRNQRYETAAKMAMELSEIEVPLKEQALEDAHFQFEHGNLLRANELVGQILGIDTRHREALELRHKLQQVVELQQKGERVRQLRATAEQAVGQKRYENALEAIDQAISLDPANTELLHYRDLIKHELKRREEIRKKLELARRAQEINDLSSAQELVDKALEVDPTDTQARSMKSLLQQEEKRQQLQELCAEASRALDLRACTRARELIQQMEGLDREFAPLDSLRQRLLQGEAEEERRSQIEELVREIRQALKASDTEQSMLLATKALTAFPDEPRLVQLRKQAEALRDAAKRELDVQEQMTRIKRLADGGQYNDALSMAEGALKRLGEDHRLHTVIVELRQNAERDRLTQAERELLARAREAMRAADYELAVKILSNARIDFPTSEEVAAELQNAEEARGRKAAALNAEAARNRELAEALDRRLAAESDPDRQVNLAEEAVARNPENERMQRTLRRARELQRQVYFALDRAREHESDRNYPEAIRQWMRIQELCPRHPDADAQIERLSALIEQASRAQTYSPTTEAPGSEYAPSYDGTPPQDQAPTSNLKLSATESATRSKKIPIIIGTGVLALAGVVFFLLMRPAPGISIRFEIDPAGAEVSVGSQRCVAPCDLKLKPGRYVAQVSFQGYTSAQKEIVAGSHPETLVLSLIPSQPKLGTLVVETNIDDVAVLVDGAPKTLTSGGKATFSVLPGKHKIAVDKTGYSAESQATDITADRESKLQFVLKPTESRTSQPPADPYFIVRSRPGAKVLVDGTEVGNVQPDSTYSFKTTPGRHHVEVRLPDYALWTSDVTAHPGPTAISADLKELPEPVILSFAPVPSEIQQGQSTDLKWQTQNASDVSIEGIGPVGTSDSKKVAPASTTPYTLVARSGGRVVRRSVTVTVTALPKPNISTFEAGSDRIQAGQTGKLIWDTQNATDVSISPDIGSVEAKGYKVVRPEKTTSYILTAKGPGGADSKISTITVDPKPVATPDLAAVPRPAPPPVTPAENPDSKAVLDTLQVGLANAYNSRSVAEIKKVWKLSKNEEKSFKENLEKKDLRSITATIKCAPPKLTGDTADCVCTQIVRTNQDGYLETSEPAKIHYRLAKEGNVWYIVGTLNK